MPLLHPHRSTLAWGYTTAILSAAILSFTAILIRHLIQTYQIPPLILAFWRDAFVALTLLIILGLLRPSVIRVRGFFIFYLVAYGLVLAIFNALWTISVALNGAAISTVLVYCSAGFTTFFGWWLLNERLDWVRLLAVACTLGGCVLVSGALDPAAWSANLMGILTGMLSGLAYTGYSLMGRSAARRGLNPWTTLFYTFGFATLFLLLYVLVSGAILPGSAVRPADLFWLGCSVPGWNILLLLAAGPTVTGFGLYNVSLGYLQSSVANLILTLEPVCTAATAYLLLGERMTNLQLGGSLMILAGVASLRLYDGLLASATQSLPQWKKGALEQTEPDRKYAPSVKDAVR